MEVKAHVKNLRVAPRKARLVVDLVRGMNIEDALNQLYFVNKGVASDVIKLVKSARANAVHNFKLDPSKLIVKKIWVDEGMTLKRWMPRAFGRATPLRKRASHITVVLGYTGEAEPVKKTEVAKTADSEIKKEEKKTEAKKDVKPKKASSKTTSKKEDKDSK